MVVVKIIVCAVILLVALFIGFAVVLYSVIRGGNQAEEEIKKRFEQLEMDGQSHCNLFL